ncbi:hypothetical protein C8J57DRAFT_1523157 [Mycena rebaudengoi]|nr:hypothetical protein C8J57DRAFT_1523157 [Mycena rebaudengoi]
MTTVEKLAAVRAAIPKRSPICKGSADVGPGQQILFYGPKEDGNAQWIDLSKTTTETLDRLSLACGQAKFGRDHEDVLDETYRKAGKMDHQDFVARFDLQKSGILRSVSEQFLDGLSSSKREIEAELYKLNVYGEGSFFKAHKDTPRAENMFGSLVVVFSTRHTGGALLLRHDGAEERFDSSAILSPFNNDTVAFVAFYSDVEHEVEVVRSGHRVTLTYNLYFTENNSGKHAKPLFDADAENLESALSALLADPTFMPRGGLLGFGLRHMYPVNQSRHAKLSALVVSLKGVDALISSVLEKMSLPVAVKTIFEDDSDGGVVVVDGIPNLEWVGQVEEPLPLLLKDNFNGQLIEDVKDRYYGDAPELTDVTWVTEITDYSTFESVFVAYGNEASVGYAYGNLALMVEVEEVDKRQK